MLLALTRTQLLEHANRSAAVRRWRLGLGSPLGAGRRTGAITSGIGPRCVGTVGTEGTQISLLLTVDVSTPLVPFFQVNGSHPYRGKTCVPNVPCVPDLC